MSHACSLIIAMQCKPTENKSNILGLYESVCLLVAADKPTVVTQLLQLMQLQMPYSIHSLSFKRQISSYAYIVIVILEDEIQYKSRFPELPQKQLNTQYFLWDNRVLWIFIGHAVIVSLKKSLRPFFVPISTTLWNQKLYILRISAFFCFVLAFVSFKMCKLDL